MTTLAPRSSARRLLVAGTLFVGLAGAGLASPAAAETPPFEPGPVIVLPTDPPEPVPCGVIACDAPDLDFHPCTFDPTVPCPGDLPFDPDLPLDGPGPIDPTDPTDPGGGPADEPTVDPGDDPGVETEVLAETAEVDEAITGQPTFTG